MCSDNYLSPYDLGWTCGYDDKLADCPFEDGTEEYAEWFEGYYQGLSDC